MNKKNRRRKEIKFLDVAAKRLSKMKLKDRQNCLVVLMAWHIIPCPEELRAAILETMQSKALDLFKAAGKRRATDAPSDLRH